MRRLLTLWLLLLSLGAPMPPRVNVRIEKMHLFPEVVKIKKGDTVVWFRYERFGYHTVWFKEEGLCRIRN